ncbi:MAG: DUF6798 domain-containing protein [Pirellulales bacterium]
MGTWTVSDSQAVGRLDWSVFLSLIGLIPAALMLGGPSRVGKVVVAQIHPFFRLAHHQTPHLFRWQQNVAGAVTVALFIACAFAAWRMIRAERDCAVASAGTSVCRRWNAARWVLRVGWIAVAISVVGLVIDLCLVPLQPQTAASLLRFYWFRWFDVVVPLAWIITVWVIVEQLSEAASDERAAVAANGSHLKRWSELALGTACLVTMLAVGKQVLSGFGDRIASADRPNLMVDSPSLKRGPEVIEDWRAVCSWIAENTPPGALFFTPRAQQTFKWYAGRAEVVSYKDVPQDGPSLIIWFDRIERCAPPRKWDSETKLPIGDPLPWKTEQLQQMQKRYGFEYVVVDLRIQREPPALELVYPLDGHENESYAVFRMPQMTH